MEKFLEELTELSKKHGLYIRARHEEDSYYAPLLIDAKLDQGANIVAESLYWNEHESKYTADKNEGDDNDDFR